MPLRARSLSTRATVSRVVETRLAMSLCTGMGWITAVLRIVVWLCAWRSSSAWTRLWAASVDRSMMRSLALRTMLREPLHHLQRHLRMVGENGQEQPARQRQHQTVLDRHHPGGARQAVDRRDLAEILALDQVGEGDLATGQSNS